MNIKRGKWQTMIQSALAEIPAEFAERVRFERESKDLRVLVDGKSVARLVEAGDRLYVDPTPYVFTLGTRKRGHQIEDVRGVVVAVVLPGLGLKRGWCGNLGTLDGRRLDGEGMLQRAPLEEAFDWMDAIAAASQDPE